MYSHVQLLQGGRGARVPRLLQSLLAAEADAATDLTNVDASGHMNIFTNTVVTLSYRLYSSTGELIEQSTEPISYLHGGHGGIFPKVEAALAQKQVGESCSVTLEPEDAFGEYDAELVRVEAQDRFPPEVKVGMQFEGYGDSNPDDDETRIYTVTDIADGKVVVDGNHPLAGQRLRFECTVLEIRPASPEELAHGHVHGAGGHHH